MAVSDTAPERAFVQRHREQEDVEYRLLPGVRPMGIRDAWRFTGNARKESREIQVLHACGRSIELPMFFTPCGAFEAL